MGPRQNGLVWPLIIWLIGLVWPLIIPSSFQYACPGAQVRAGLKHEKKKKKGAERYRDMLWLYAKRCESYAEHEAGKWTASWPGYVI